MIFEKFYVKIHLGLWTSFDFTRTTKHGGHLLYLSDTSKLDQGLVHIKFAKSAPLPLWATYSSAHGEDLFLILTWNFPCSYLWPLPLFLSQCTSKKTLVLTSLCAKTGSWRQPLGPLEPLLLKDTQTQLSQHFLIAVLCSTSCPAGLPFSITLLPACAAV